MTLLKTRLEAAVAHAKFVKEAHVRQVKGKLGRTDILTVVQSFRGDDPVAAVFVPPDRDVMLLVADISARGFSADILAITTETYHAQVPTSPTTGESWEPGDLQEYFEAHGRDNGVVDEALLVQVWNRAGDAAVQSLPYHITGRVTQWLEPLDVVEGMTFEGRVPDALAKIMATETGHQFMARTMGGLPAGLDVVALGDAAAVTAIKERVERDVTVVVFGEPGSARHQVLKRILGPSVRLENPSRWN